MDIADQIIEAGVVNTVPVTMTNQEAEPISGTFTITGPQSGATQTVSVPEVAPGQTITGDVEVLIPAGVTGSHLLNAVFTTSNGRKSHFDFTVTVEGTDQVGLTVTGTPEVRDVNTNPYSVGDQVAYTLRATSTSNVTANVVPTAGSFNSGLLPPTAPKCRFNNLPAGGVYNCGSPRHTVTAADLQNGSFTPTVTYTVTASADSSLTKTVTFTGDPVPLTAPLSATIVGQRADGGRNLAANPYTVGEQVPYTYTVTNTAPFTESIAPVSGPFAPFVPPGAGNCRFNNLAAGANYTCATPLHTVTQADLDAGFFQATSTWDISAAGRTTKTVTIDGGEIDVRAR